MEKLTARIDEHFTGKVNERESYHEIKDKFPIKVNIEKDWTGRYYKINVPPMTMEYETYLELGDNLSDSAIKYGKSNGLTYSKEIEKYGNDVAPSQYDYSNGEASFSASTEQDVKNWLKLYKDKVYAEKF